MILRYSKTGRSKNPVPQNSECAESRFNKADLAAKEDDGMNAQTALEFIPPTTKAT